MSKGFNYTPVHEVMMRNVFLNTELKLNDSNTELSEYDIQSMIHDFFFLRKEKYGIINVKRERESKTDNIISHTAGEKVYFELKTYFKKNEKFIKSDFDHDLKKLLCKSRQKHSRAYFIIAGISGKFKENELKEYDFLLAKFKKIRNSITYTIVDERKKVHILLRPSIGQSRGKCRLWSWEIVGTSLKKRTFTK